MNKGRIEYWTGRITKGIAQTAKHTPYYKRRMGIKMTFFLIKYKIKVISCSPIHIKLVHEVIIVL